MTSLTQRLGERPDDSYWRGRLEAEDRRYHEISERLERKAGELAAAQLKYQLLKERVMRKAAQAGHRGSGSVQAPAAQPMGSFFGSLDTIVAVDALGASSGARPQQSAAPEASVTSRPPLSGQRRRRDQPEPPPQEGEEREGEGSRQE